MAPGYCTRSFLAIAPCCHNTYPDPSPNKLSICFGSAKTKSPPGHRMSSFAVSCCVCETQAEQHQKPPSCKDYFARPSMVLPVGGFAGSVVCPGVAGAY